jgi:hypothetical protein
MVKRLALLFMLTSAAALADPETDLRAGIRVLGRTSFSWEVTARQRLSGEAVAPQLNPNAPLIVQGKHDPQTYTEITLLPSRDALAVPVTAYFKHGDAVGQTPGGWLRRTEIREVESSGPDKVVDFQGKQLRRSRVFAVVLRAMAMAPPLDELLDLMTDIKAYRAADGLVIGELRDAAIEKLWAEPRAKSAPEIQGTVIFKFNEGAVSEYHLLLAIGFPNSKTGKVAWQMMQWTTRIKGIGSTTVTPPETAVKKLDD